MTALGREKTERHDDIVYLRDELNALFEQYHNDHANSPTTGKTRSNVEQTPEQAAIRAEEPPDTPTAEDDPVLASDTDQDLASWNQYKRDLEERRQNAVLYGVFNKVLYRGLASEWEHATKRRIEAQDRYETWATQEAEQVFDTLERTLGERGQSSSTTGIVYLVRCIRWVWRPHSGFTHLTRSRQHRLP